eukprot:TRINITY_DN4302_c0_g1_i1.p2 TRINITY_DN4302_c0_g1~~TRINITY_DN4302_c0_g1_i1.p2  ORF type:complete len:346 (-),score=88.88 TRINITY_DN4302_c0_g1_i1:1376-2413(-)
MAECATQQLLPLAGAASTRRRRKRETITASVSDESVVEQKDGFTFTKKVSVTTTTVSREIDPPQPQAENRDEKSPEITPPAPSQIAQQQAEEEEPPQSPEKKKRRVHRKLKVPEYPSNLVAENIGDVASIENCIDMPEECMTNLFLAVVEAEVAATAECFTEHFSYIHDFVADVCADFSKQVEDPQFKPRMKVRQRVDAQREKLLHNEDNVFLSIRKKKLEMALSRFEAEEKRWNEVDERIQDLISNQETRSKLLSSSFDDSGVAQGVLESLPKPDLIDKLHKKIHDVAAKAAGLAQEVTATVQKSKDIMEWMKTSGKDSLEDVEMTDYDVENTRDLALEFLNNF